MITKSRLIIVSLTGVFVLPFISLAQIRYAFDSFLADGNWKIFSLFLIALIGSKVGRARRRKRFDLSSK